MTSEQIDSRKIPIPPDFMVKMGQLLGDDYESFQACYSQPVESGLRINTLKCTPDIFIRMVETKSIGWSEEIFEPLPWCPSGYRIVEIQDSSANDIRFGKHPFHAAGIYYLQDPSAMAVAEILNPQPGERILDLSAAPGGKTTHIAALMNNQGLLVANEIHPRRVWDLAQNIERCGIINTAITNEQPHRLATHLGPFFDRVLVDAPCSGEGMFRKSGEAAQAWSRQLVESCAKRQLAILANAAKMVKPGGYLVYSTCTFSPEENEQVIARFFEEHGINGYFDLVQIGYKPGFSQGRQDWLSDKYSKNPPLDRTIRLWPHHQGAEGHFVALMRCIDCRSNSAAFIERKPTSSSGISLFNQFVHENLTTHFFPENITIKGSYVYQVPNGAQFLDGIKTIHPGWWLGELRKGRFIPSHSLAMGLLPGQVRNCEFISIESADIQRYFRGESLEKQGNKGWVWVALQISGFDISFPMGWGKRSQGVLKNSYPRGLRNLI